METNSISERLNFIDDMILCGIEKHVGVGNLEHLHDYIITFHNGVYIEVSMTMLAILSQINLMKENFV